jgi:Undecaprenyl-phosphate galactose phosphotransferase WbaP
MLYESLTKFFRKGKVALLFVLNDQIIFLIAIWVSLYLRNLLLGPGVAWQTILPFWKIGSIFLLVVLSSMGLYPGYGLSAVKELERLTKGLVFSFIWLSTVFYLNKPLQDLPRSIFLGTAIICLALSPVSRLLLRSFISRFSWYGQPVAILGNAETTSRVQEALLRVRRLGWRPVFIFSAESYKELDHHIRKIEAVIVTSRDDVTDDVARWLSQRFRHVIFIQSKNFGSLWVEPRDLEGELALEFHYHLLVKRNLLVKLMIDRVGGLLLLILFSPVMLLIAILIRLDSKGPVLFKQKRLGRHMKPFWVFKFRTMVEDAEARLEQILSEDANAREEYETYHKLSDDPRITRVGRWLRKLSLDELPQILNVIRGEMSLVGPRAYMVSELPDMGSYASVILQISPGMTGWWQVLGRNDVSFQKRLQMDEYYIANWSLWMDIYILLKTVQVILQANGT